MVAFVLALVLRFQSLVGRLQMALFCGQSLHHSRFQSLVGRLQMVVAPTYGLLQRVTLPAALRVLKLFVGGDYRAIERTFYLRTGGHVYFGSADKPLSLEGVHVYAAWLDEAGQMKREAWDVALRRAGLYEAPVLLTTTPYNLGWLKLEVYDKWAEGDRDYFVVQFPSYWNPVYPRAEYLRAKRTLPRWKFDMFYRG